ncbi:MAG TPA: tetratricopeptide repeat protein [Gemmatimonadales bacterium]|nr:tetratricopeptide repeat protein [Gemmatimonadales bacterium]
MKGYTVADVAQLIKLAPAQVRAFARDGFLSPGRGPRGDFRFSFQDLVVLRAAKDLAAARIPARRIRRTLKRLRQELPRGRSLAELRITAEGERIVVRDGETAWNPDSGQVVIDFQVRDLATRAAPIARRTARAAQAAEADYDADGWYELGLELEAVAPQEARDAYRRALELDPHHADAHVNLGRLLQEEDLTEEAETHYRAALADSPEHATAWFDLGTALEDLRRPGDAVEAYRRAILADRRLADAHFNLARLYEKAGKKAAALRHLGIYQRLTD